MAHLAVFPTPRPLYDVDPLFQVAGPAPLVPLSTQPHCLLIVYRCTRTPSLGLESSCLETWRITPSSSSVFIASPTIKHDVVM